MQQNQEPCPQRDSQPAIPESLLRPWSLLLGTTHTHTHTPRFGNITLPCSLSPATPMVSAGSVSSGLRMVCCLSANCFLFFHFCLSHTHLKPKTPLGQITLWTIQISSLISCEWNVGWCRKLRQKLGIEKEDQHRRHFRAHSKRFPKILRATNLSNHYYFVFHSSS